ncbi:VOC family protein [Catellatospora sp. KI3]|uniref:VOC family protein n=1 Tax=Catellatospora sp. KI3 TaxID=3041620 RepID=UPI0024823AF1|nr:VOC family protein [Catellatospora sp. KI3]MDI1459346.1 VOC family protein [Catellatospora sp. KI3]
MTGKVVHFEVPVDDVERARSFYTDAFGWQLDAMPGFDYIWARTTRTDDRGMPAEPGAINGGMTRREAPVTQPTITIEVDDIDTALAKVVALGGTVLQERQAVGEMGFTAYIADTEGNPLGLWQNA